MRISLTILVERDGAEQVLLCCNTYDDLGRLATQSLGSSNVSSLPITHQEDILLCTYCLFTIIIVPNLNLLNKTCHT